MISYYDILTMIKEKNVIPSEIELHLCGSSEVYYFSKEDSSYLLKDESKESTNFHLYLNECITDLQTLENIFRIVKE